MDSDAFTKIRKIVPKVLVNLLRIAVNMDIYLFFQMILTDIV